jgi:hypothetical protein
MRTWAVLAAMLAVLVLATETRAADAGAAAPLPACVLVASQSRYIPFGYNHFVTLTNGCSKPATCVVSTDVNPSPQNVAVAAGASVEVLTYMAAASSTFIASVSCQLR